MTTSDKFQRRSFKVAFKLTAKSVRTHILTFDIFENRIGGLGSCEDSTIGAGAGAGAAEQFYSEPEPEPECCPGAGAGAGADQKCHGSASLLKCIPDVGPGEPRILKCILDAGPWEPRILKCTGCPIIDVTP